MQIVQSNEADCLVTYSKELIDKMLEVIPLAELAVQREIISCIPEVVDDSKHPEVAGRLR